MARQPPRPAPGGGRTPVDDFAALDAAASRGAPPPQRRPGGPPGPGQGPPPGQRPAGPPPGAGPPRPAGAGPPVGAGPPRGPPPGSQPPPSMQQQRPGGPGPQGPPPGQRPPGPPGQGPPPGQRPPGPPPGAGPPRPAGGPPQGAPAPAARPGPGHPSQQLHQPIGPPRPAPQAVHQPVAAAPSQQTIPRKAPPPPAEVSSDDGYSDEDFADDFEPEDEEPTPPPVKKPIVSAAAIAAIPSASQVQQMIAQENRQLSAQAPAPIKPAGPPTGGMLSASNDVAPVRKYVPLPNKQQRANQASNKEASRKDSRARRILQQVSLSIERFDNLFNMDPLSKLELAAREKQKGRTRDCGSQYNEDWLTQEAQTDEIETYTLGAQAPDDLSAKVIITRNSGTSTSTSTSTGTDPMPSSSTGSLSTGRLTSFLNASSLVMETLLSESVAVAAGANGGGGGVVSASFTSGPGSLAAVSLAGLQLKLPRVFGPRAIKDVVFSKQRNQSLLVAYGRVDLGSLDAGSIPRNTSSARAAFEGTAHKGLVLVWDLLAPNYPSKVLLLDGTPSCVGQDHTRGHIVFAGTEEGSVAVWDLREDTNLHRALPDPEAKAAGYAHTHVLRQASFTTDCMKDVNHESGVRRIYSLAERSDLKRGGAGGLAEAVEAASFDLASLAGAGDVSSNFQMATLDEVGGLSVWTGIELGQVDPAGSEIDLGLAPGARVKIVRSAVLLSSEAKQQQSFDVAFKTDETNEYVVALGRGQLRRGRRYGAKPLPSEYTQLSRALGDDPACVVFHPAYPSYFLAGYKSGSVCLFHVASSRALATWLHLFSDDRGGAGSGGYAGANSGVVRLEWSSFRSSVFVALDARGQMLLFDLVKNAQKPIASAQLAMAPSAGDTTPPPPPLLSLSTKHQRAIGLSAHMLAYPVPSVQGQAIVEVHALKPAFSTDTDQERTAFAAFLQHVHADV